MYTLIASQLGNIHIIDLCIEYTHHGVRVFGFYPVAMVIIDTTKRKCTCTVVEQLHDNKSLMGKLGHGREQSYSGKDFKLSKSTCYFGHHIINNMTSLNS